MYKYKFLDPLHPLNNIEITNYFNDEPRFIGVFSRNNSPKIKNETNLINLDDKIVKEHIGFHYLFVKM